MTGDDLPILLPALCAGLLVLATHVPLGRLVLDRGIVFIDLAVAQVAGLGVVAANVAGFEGGGWSVQAAALASALTAALLLGWTERRLGHLQEAVIGVVFVAAASAEIVLLGFNPHGAEHLKDLLVGQILWVTFEQLQPVLLVYAAVLALLWRLDLSRRRFLFYALFAVTVTVSVQLVGVFLVFASLIVPALVAKMTVRQGTLPLAYGVGLAGYIIGLLLSALFDWPTGAAIVCALALVGLVAGIAVARLRPA